MQPMAAYQAANGWKGDLYGSVRRSIPWARNPRWNRMYVSAIPSQLVKPATAILINS